MSSKRKLRALLAIVSPTVTACCLVAIIWLSLNVSIDAGIENLPFNEVTGKAVDTQLALSETLFQVGILMLGALWGLVIAKKDEIQLVFSQRSEVIMFVGSSSLLLMSVCAHGFYLDSVSHYFVDAAVASERGGLPASVPDIFDQNVRYLFICQFVSLLAGMINGVLIFISAHKLRD